MLGWAGWGQEMAWWERVSPADPKPFHRARTAGAAWPPLLGVPSILSSLRVGWSWLSGALLSLSPPQLKKRALDQLRLVKPKHGGSPAGDSSEPLLLEHCSGGRAVAEAYPLAAHGVASGMSGEPGGWWSL